MNIKIDPQDGGAKAALLALTILRTLIISSFEFRWSVFIIGIIIVIEYWKVNFNFSDHAPLALLKEGARIASLLFLFQFAHVITDKGSKKLFMINFGYDFIVAIISVFGLALL